MQASVARAFPRERTTQTASQTWPGGRGSSVDARNPGPAAKRDLRPGGSIFGRRVPQRVSPSRVLKRSPPGLATAGLAPPIPGVSAQLPCRRIRSPDLQRLPGRRSEIARNPRARVKRHFGARVPHDPDSNAGSRELLDRPVCVCVCVGGGGLLLAADSSAGPQ